MFRSWQRAGVIRRRILDGLVIALVATLPGAVSPARVAATPPPPTVPTIPGADPSVLARPDKMAALITARLTNQRVTITDLTSETSMFFALPSGEIQAEVFAAPVRVGTPEGWVPIDLTLRLQADGSVAPVAHPGGLRLSGGGPAAEHDLATVDAGGRRLGMRWPGALPAPVLTGSRATYPEALAGVDVVVEATRTGFEQFLIVKDRAAAARLNRISLPLSAPGLSVVPDGVGGHQLKDEAGQLLGRVPAPVMWDARGDGRPGPDGFVAPRMAGVPSRVSARQGDRVPMELTPDRAWLADPQTRYPVTVDPSVQLGAWFDTFVRDSETTDRSGFNYLSVGKGTFFLSRSLLHWPTSQLSGQTVSSATLSLFNYYSTTCAANGWQLWTVGAFDASVRWNSQPAWLNHESSSTQTKGFDSTCDDGWVTTDATGFFQRAADAGAPVGFMGLRATDETVLAGYKDFRSNESTQPSKVNITYTSQPRVGTQTTTPATICTTGGGRPYIAATRPQLRAQVSDPSGVSVRATFEWWVTNGAVIGSTTTGYSPSGSTLSATVPSGAFINAGPYSWRVRGNNGTADGAWSPWCEFTVDTVAPSAAPGVSSATYPERSETPDGYIYSVEPRPFEGGTSVVTALTGDDVVTTVSLPFPFTLYGQQYTSAWVDTNGKMSFVDPEGPNGTGQPALPNPALPNGALYVFGEDLVIDGSASVRTATYGSAPQRRFVVEWNNAMRFHNNDDRITAAVTVYENGEIATNYSGIDPGSEGERGSGAVVGVENATGTQAEQYSRERPVLVDNTAIVFRPGVLPPTSYTKTTATQTYAGGTVVTGITGDDEIGTIALPFPVNFYGRVYTSVYADTNGQLYFEHPSGSHTDCQPIPSTEDPNAGLYVFCDDLWIDASASIRTATLGAAPSRQFIIEWHNVSRFNNMSQRFNLAVTLSESGTISLNYSSLDNEDEQGLSAHTGIENRAGTAGIQHSSLQPVLANNTAIIFTPNTGGATSTGGAGVPGTFTFTPSGVTDIAAYQYGLNTNPPSTMVNAVTLGGNGSATITPTADGPQTVYVRSQDRAGNQSAIKNYHFFAGPGGLTSPKPGDITAAFVPLTAAGHSAATGATYQWRRADTDDWVDIPTSFVSYAVGGSPVLAWPLTTIGSGNFAKLNWNVEATLGAADAQSIPRDGPLQIRAIFSGLTNGIATPVKFSFDRNLAVASTVGIGPGSVNLITGNLTVTAADAVASGNAVGRTLNTREPGGVDPMFGPGWVSGVVVGEASAPYTKLNVYGSLVQISLPDGTTLGFTKKTTTGTGASYDPPPDSEGLILVYTSAPNTYLLTDDAGNKVTFGRAPTDPAGQYAPTAATPPGSGNTTTYSWEKATVDGQDVVRPTKVLSPVPSGVTCTTLVRGCRAVTFAYAAATTTTGTAEAQWGDYLGRITSISLTAWDPDAAPAAMRTVILATYAYDSTGRLRAAWDPRLDYVDGGVTKHLWERYAYDGNGILTTITPAGQEPWQLAYTTIPGDAGNGRLLSASRSALSAGIAISTVVYKVPTSGVGAPYDLSPAQTSRWGQGEAPVSAAAVFPPNQIPGGNQSIGVAPSSHERANVAYMDANARILNSVVPGGYMTATWFDTHGNIVRELTAGNRQRALDASPSDAPAQEATLAAALSSESVFSADGELLIDEFGPEHAAVLPDGSTVRARSHTAHVYDQGAPGTGGPYRLETTRIDSARYTNASGVQVDADARTTTTGYDWTLQRETVSIVDPTGLALATRIGYDAEGQVVSTTTPAGGTSTTTPSTRTTVYYTAATNAAHPECGNHAEWDGLTCLTKPGGQPSSGPELPMTVTTYDMFNQTRIAVEKNSGGVLRTTTVIYDSAGRPYEASVTAASGLGAAVPTTRNVYESSTGQLVRTQSVVASVVTAEIIRSYDALGRPTTYTDADANVSTTTYDLLSRVATHNDGKATRTYAYDGGTERRSLPTSVVDTNAGTFTGSYNADSALISETWPTGMVVKSTVDETSAAVGQRYEKPGCGGSDCTVFDESIATTGHGRWRDRASTLSAQTYMYDMAGRLTTVNDIVGGQCNTRTYTFSTATNRTGLTTYGPASGTGACQTTTSAGIRVWSFDTADRLTTTGTVYDALGRTTTVPAANADPAAGDVTVTYHHTDLVDSITQGGRTTDYTLDVTNDRIRSWTDNRDGTPLEHRHHYIDDGDNPAWTQETTTDWARVISGLGGMAGALNSTDSAVTWQIANLHGDLVASTQTGEAGLTATHEATEYGLNRNTTDTSTRRYGWLGAHQRAADAPSGITLMGVRLYNPATGRFLSVDPIRGGSCNDYEYACADPVNNLDLDGRAIPAFIVGIYYGARAVVMACRVSRNWCVRAILSLVRLARNSMRRVVVWIVWMFVALSRTPRIKAALSCAQRWGDFLNNLGGQYVSNKGYPGAARIVGWMAGFIYGYIAGVSCFPGKYK